MQLVKQSKLRYDATFEQIYCNRERNFTRDQQLALADCSFIMVISDYTHPHFSFKTI